jgi:subtilisin family serine protease
MDPAVRALLARVQQLLRRKDVRPNEAVVTFKDDAALARFLARAGNAGLTVVGQVNGLRAVRVRFDDAGALSGDIAQHASDYNDLSGNYLVSAPPAPTKEQRAALNEEAFGNGALAFIGATGDRSQWGRGVTIAILDTGVGADPTFGPGRVSTLDIGLGAAPGTAADDGHGTSVASLAAGKAPDAGGVAPGANLLSIRVTDASGTSDIFTLAQGIVAAVDAGAKVVNVSMGGYGTDAALTNAITYATDHGAVIVAAAGNDQAAQLNWPAADPRVISVGAVDKAEQQVTFSNSGPQLQLTAPGYGVQTAWLDGQRAYVDGTSASAPLVSGSIAALLSQNPELTPAQAAQLLTQTASDAGPPGDDPAYGHGILNLGWAMNANNPSYVDTAVSSHYFDAATNTMDFVVQNRSGHAVAGLTLDVSANGNALSYALPDLAPGATTVVRQPVDASQFSSSGQIQYTTNLVNPTGLTDQVPSNNRRSSVLTHGK